MSDFLIDEYGKQIWYDAKSIFRSDHDGIWRAIRYPNQPEFYVRPHREDGPAIIWPDGSEFYFLSGKYHREDGPALIYQYATKFYLNNKKYYFDDWCKKLNKSEEEINFIKLRYINE